MTSQICFKNDDNVTLEFKINATKSRISIKKILSRFIEKFNQAPDLWIEQLGLDEKN